MGKQTHQVMVGGVPLGGGAPVVVQSMLNAPAKDVAANLAQIEALAEAGCEVVRMAIPHRDCLDAFAAVCAESLLPVVADVHFDAQIAIEAARRGAAKLRINPGNIGGLAKTDAVIDAAGEAGRPDAAAEAHRVGRRLCALLRRRARVPRRGGVRQGA